MPRPKRHRRIRGHPSRELFKPNTIRGRDLEIVYIENDEYEALRLKDLEEIKQTDAARMMNISQPTFYRLISSARKKIADAIINKKAIQIGKSPKNREQI